MPPALRPMLDGSPLRKPVPLATRLYWSAYLMGHAFGQARADRRPASRILRDQARRLRRIVAYAYRFVPYYRETLDALRLSPADFRTAANLARLPIIDPDALRRDAGRFVSTERRPEGLVVLRSAGSTGVPRTVRYDPASLIQSAAHGERTRRVLARHLGKRFGYRNALIVPATSSTTDIQRFWDDHLLAPRGVPTRRRLFSMFDPPEVTVAGLNDFRPDAIYTYGSYLEILFPHLKARGAFFHKPKLIAYSSTGLTESIRRLIEDEFAIPVFSAYQAVEALKIGFECERHTGIHLNIDICPVRIVDDEGHPVPHGQPGRVVISNLVNLGTVLLNYDLGDIAAVRPEPCRCGRTLPLLSFPLGRQDDLLRLPSGRIIQPQALARIFRDEPRVWRYQVVQLAPTRIRIALVPAPGADLEAMKRRILAAFRRVLGGTVSLEVRYVKSIPPTPGGKTRAVLSLCPGERASDSPSATAG